MTAFTCLAALSVSSVRCADPLAGIPATELYPLMPAALLEDQTTPAPYTVVLLPPGGSPGSAFSVTVKREDGQELLARFFVDRSRNCSTDGNGGHINCQDSDYLTNSALPASGGTVRNVHWPFPADRFSAPFRCWRVDLYVSPAFQADITVANLPVREGDALHVWWLVATPDSTGSHYPTLDQCTASLAN